MGKSDLAGCRILVVEDEAILALLIEESLIEAGCEVIGPASRVSTALDLIRDAKPDAAFLDVSVRDGKTYDAARQLLALGIPFVISSGYGDLSLPEDLRGERRLTKPFSPEELTVEIRRLCEEVQAKAEARA